MPLFYLHLWDLLRGLPVERSRVWLHVALLQTWIVLSPVPWSNVLYELGSIGTPLGFRFPTQDRLLEPFPMQNPLYFFPEPIHHLRNTFHFSESAGGRGIWRYFGRFVLRVHSHLWYITFSLTLRPLEDTTLFMFSFIYMFGKCLFIVTDN